MSEPSQFSVSLQQSPMRMGGIVLCGGASSRMGTPKHLLRVGEETVLERVAGVLGSVVLPVVIVAAGEQELPQLPGCLIIHDVLPHAGPLPALQLGLLALREHADAAFVAACDLPGLSAPFIRAVIAELGPEDHIALPVAAGRPQPLAAVYRIGVADQIPQLLEAGERRVLSLRQKCRTREIPEAMLKQADPELLSLCNLNTPEDYTEFLSTLQRSQSS